MTRHPFLKTLKDKLNESLKAVLPIIAIVILLSLTVAPMDAGIMLAFLFGGVLLIFGMMLFSIGAEVAMEPMGSIIGGRVTRTRKLWLILLLSFVLGIMVTVSEPDLQVLANQIRDIPSTVMILTVGAGVGLFLVLALIRMFFNVRFRDLLLICYAVVFILCVFCPPEFLAVAFDSGGVTTGPMTVPFIMSFGVGISAIRNDKHAADDSFGLVALSSVGPILAVLILSLVFRVGGADYSAIETPDVKQTVELSTLFTKALPGYAGEIAVALLPIAVFFFVFEAVCVRMDKAKLNRIVIGIIYTYTGLTIFLTGANVGFMPAGSFLGQAITFSGIRWAVIPIGMLIGFFIVKAEPAVYVLMRQVEELTDGAITGKSLQLSLCTGVSVSIGLSMLRVLTGFSILWYLIPGYVIAFILAFFTPKIFTPIAFDSGGVASGPMTATFLLSFAIGVCSAAGGNIVTDAFGLVAMVAMTPLITIQLLGIVYRIRSARHVQETVETDLFADLPDDAIIEL